MNKTTSKSFEVCALANVTGGVSQGWCTGLADGYDDAYYKSVAKLPKKLQQGDTKADAIKECRAQYDLGSWGGLANVSSDPGSHDLLKMIGRVGKEPQG